MNCKKECMEQKKDGTLKDCPILKDNEELKKDKEWLDNTNNEQTKVILELQERIREVENDSNNCEHWSYERIKELEQQVEQLSNDNHVLKTSFITQQEQIEKMRCCGNCKHYYCSNDTKGKCKLLNPNANKCGFNICAKWELAE